MKFVVSIIFIFVKLILSEESYPTNFISSLRWNTKKIVYGTVAIEDEPFRDFVKQEIDKFNQVFGELVTWVYEEDYKKLVKFDRYGWFMEANYNCGRTAARHLDPTTIVMSMNKIYCGANESQAHILK